MTTYDRYGDPVTLADITTNDDERATPAPLAPQTGPLIDAMNRAIAAHRTHDTTDAGDAPF